jgi:DNA repair protein RadC
MMRINRYTVKLVKEGGINYSLDESVDTPNVARSVVEKVFSLSSSPVEKFGIIALSVKNRITGIHIIAVGGLNTTVIEPREVFQHAFLNNAASIVLFHNHPSGDTQPSNADIQLTQRLSDAGQLLGIKVLDHIILGEDAMYTSLKEMGLF